MIKQLETLSWLQAAIDLIHEAKGAETQRGGFITDHLDAAETWLNKVEDFLNETKSSPKPLVWKDREDSDGWGGSDVIGSYSNNVFMHHYWTSWKGTNDAPWILFYGSKVILHYHSEAEAIKAAEEHYAFHFSEIMQ